MFLTLAYVALVILRIAWVFLPQTGYIHPDEFFQFSERVAADVFGYETATVWEFDSARPLRSVFFPFLICGLPFAALRELAARLPPSSPAALAPLSGYWLLVAPRFVMAMLSLVVDRCLHEVCRALGVDALPSLLLFASSYATLVLCTRTLTNAVETVLLALLLALVVRDARLTGRLHSHRRRLQQAATDAAANAAKGDAGGASSTTCTDESTASGAAALPADGASEVGASTQRQLYSLPDGAMSDAGLAATTATAVDGGFDSELSDPPGITPPQPQQQSSPFQARTRLAEAYRAIQSNNFLIVTVVVAGFFNRPTFLAFAAAPCWYWLLGGGSSSSSAHLVPRPADARRAIVTCLCCAPYALNVAAMLVLWDTYYYRSFDASAVARQLGTSGDDSGLFGALVGSFVLTPLNFLAYNSDPSNLAEHGTHPRYLHATVNAPLLLGPVAPLAAAAAALLWLPGGGSEVSGDSSQHQSPAQPAEQRRSQPAATVSAAAAAPDGLTKDAEAEVDDQEAVKSQSPSWTLAIGRMLAATLVVPLLCLSAFPHQEPRFLLPLVGPATVLAGASLRRLLPGRRPRWAFVAVWLAFNVAGSALYGFAHQGGLVPAMLRLGDGHLLPTQSTIAASSTEAAADSQRPSLACRGGRVDVIFYHTYMPPLHLLGRQQPAAAEEGDGCDLVVHDLKGTDGATLRTALGQLLRASGGGGEALLVTPLDAEDLGLGGAYAASTVARFFPHVTFEDLPPVRRLLAVLPGGRLDRAATLSNARRAFSLSIYRVTDALLRDHVLPSSSDGQLTVSVIINTPALPA